MRLSPTLAIIPCRGGSRRIPRKWAQLVAGKPLLQHTIDIARASTCITRLVVSTEDKAIAAYARLRGVEVVDRPADLADDDTPLSDVVAHAAAALDWESDVVVLQPTCPLLRPDTVDRVVAEWRAGGADWAITAAKAPHLYWQGGQPLNIRRNSQQLAENPYCPYRESGAVQMFTEAASFGVIHSRTTIPIAPTEALDIDTHADLEAARLHLGRKTILFHVVASDEKGSGHLRRCLQLTDALSHHDVWWDDRGLEQWARSIAEEHGVRWASQAVNITAFGDAQEVWVGGPLSTADLAVIDSLEDADQIVPRYAADGIPTVVFEPDGAQRARRFADLVIDEFDTPELAILRPEFLCLPPYEVNPKASNVLITFGGTDPTGMNQRVSKIVRHGADATVLVADRGLQESMAEMMRWADLVITSQGRTVHEAAAVGVPVVSVAVNERESRHCRLPGVVYLGLAHTLSDAALLDTVNRLLGSPALRGEMSATSSRAIDGRGLGRVVRKIEGLLNE